MNNTLETVVVNVFGDTAQQFVIDPNWREGYAQYLKDVEAKKQLNKEHENE